MNSTIAVPQRLDPLTAVEIAAVRALLAADGRLRPTHRFPLVELDETPSLPRGARVTLLDRAGGAVSVVRVQLDPPGIVEWHQIPVDAPP